MSTQTYASGAQERAQGAQRSATAGAAANLLATVRATLEDAKAEDIVAIDLAGKSAIGDHMIIASGRSARHVGAIAEQLGKKLKTLGYGRVRMEGLSNCDWVLVDAGDVIVHVFRPEVRDFYNLEKMWSASSQAIETSAPLA